ncbi:MAG: sodium:calcium antiporter, partial [Halobacteria archaeon]|nr:sodium:calcium antiporter [Halobacteria archaeon]
MLSRLRLRLPSRLRHPLTALAAVVSLTLPWVALRASGLVQSLPTLGVIAVSGIAVVGAAFVLTWAAETAEMDVPREFAIAVLAIIAVAPEYAVDALYAWEAGANPGSPESMAAANLAIANMTGANRILIGLGWSGIALYAIYRAWSSSSASGARKEGFFSDTVELDPRISLELVFIGVATVFAFFIPVGGGIGAFDAVFLVGLYAVYVYFVLQSE